MRWLWPATWKECPCVLPGNSVASWAVRRRLWWRRNCRRLRQQQDLVAVVLGGCGLRRPRAWLGDKPSSGQPRITARLLITANDLGGDLHCPATACVNPNNAVGVAQFFVNADRARRIGDSIQIEADPANRGGRASTTPKRTTGAGSSGPWQPIDVGSNGR